MVVVMVWASPASIFDFGGAQEGPFSAALENGFSRWCPTKQVFFYYKPQTAAAAAAATAVSAAAASDVGRRAPRTRT